MESRLRGVTVLLTGATGGIGVLTAEALASAGATLLIHGRDALKVEHAVAALTREGAPARGLVADLASLEQTAQLGRTIAQGPSKLDVLINNAGVGFGRDAKVRQTSRDGLELRFAVNYLAPLLLTQVLLDSGRPQRAVINVASIGQEALDFDDLLSERGYSGIRAYRRSKLALVMMSFDLAETHRELQVHALHPGTLLDTGMVREAGIVALGPAGRGAEAILAVLQTALDGGPSGRYFDEGLPARAHPQAYDAAARRRLRAASLALIARFRRE